MTILQQTSNVHVSSNDVFALVHASECRGQDVVGTLLSNSADYITTLHSQCMLIGLNLKQFRCNNSVSTHAMI